MSELQPGITEHTLSELDLTTDTPRDIKVVCGFNLTDMGNANRLIALHGGDIRYLCCAQDVVCVEWHSMDT